MDIRCSKITERATVVAEIGRRRKAEFKVCVYKKWRQPPRGTRVAGLSGRIAPPVVILDNEKTTMILSGVGFKPSLQVIDTFCI